MYQIFSIYDSKAEAYLQPFFALSRGIAIRMIMKATADSESDFYRFAADYTLFHIGAWDPQKGTIEMLDSFINVDNLLKYKEIGENG